MTGFLNFYKRSGISSFGALGELKRICGEKKAGHAGTLDPMASGVLPTAFGRAAKFIELLPNADKVYTADFRLGVETDTLDITGQVVSERAVLCSEAEVRETAARFVGEIRQVPPMFSALSKDGVRLYELARRGIEVPREPRTVRIDGIEFLPPGASGDYRIRVRCGKGTYIRSLIADIGAALGCGAVMTALERTASNGFSARDAVTAEQVCKAAERGELSSLLIPVDSVLSVYPSVTVTEGQARRFRNGGSLAFERLRDLPDGSSPLRVYAPDGSFLGVGERADAELRMKKLYEV